MVDDQILELVSELRLPSFELLHRCKPEEPARYRLAVRLDEMQIKPGVVVAYPVSVYAGGLPGLGVQVRLPCHEPGIFKFLERSRKMSVDGDAKLSRDSGRRHRTARQRFKHGPPVDRLGAEHGVERLVELAEEQPLLEEAHPAHVLVNGQRRTYLLKITGHAAHDGQNVEFLGR